MEEPKPVRPLELFEGRGINMFYNSKMQGELLQIFKNFIDKSEYHVSIQTNAVPEDTDSEAPKKKPIRKFSTKKDPSLSILFRNRKKLGNVGISALDKLKFDACVKSKSFGTESNKVLY